MEKQSKELFSTQDVALISLFVALITVCSFIRIPFGTIPFTLQTLGVYVTVGLLGLKRGVAAVAVYILMGIIGFPVFGGAGGMAVLAGNTGGYITGFILSAIVIGSVKKYLKGKKNATRFVIALISMILGEVACLIVGTVQFMLLSNVGFAVALTYCVIPFIIPDLLKIIVATGFVQSSGMKRLLQG